MRKPAPATVIATVALFVALGGVGIAATGGNFILGASNTAGAKTSLSTQVNGKALDITNTNTGASATALGLNVAAGHAPLTVNSQTKVANLNADQLDGLDSARFVRGKGASIITGRVVTTPIDPNYPEVPFLTVPGFGTLTGKCPDFAPYLYVDFHHAQGGDWVARDIYRRDSNVNGPFIYTAGPAGSVSAVIDADQGGSHATMVIVHVGGLTAMIDVYANYGQLSCDFFAQAIVSQGG
jgi:hypothetical protein